MINIANITATAFRIAGNVTGIVKTATYLNIVNGSYDTETGTVTENPTAVSVSAMFLDFSEKETDGQDYRMGDKKVLIQAADLSSLTQISLQDKLTDEHGVSWEIIGRSIDALGAIHTLHCRARSL